MKTKFFWIKFLTITAIVFLFGHNIIAQKPAIEWVDIPGGSFIMGSPKEEFNRIENEIQHKVTLSPFRMSKYEVTILQFKFFIVATGYIPDSYKGNRVRVPGDTNENNKEGGSYVYVDSKFVFKTDVNWQCDERGNIRPEKDYNFPVIHISWNDAIAFATWCGCRLPTESEWEYACRAGTSTPYNTGNNLTTSNANYDGTYPYNYNEKGIFREKQMPVGSFSPNMWGLFDMHGNVSEYCSDWYGEYPNTDLTNPRGSQESTFHITRGGNWYSNAQSCRSAFRNQYPGYQKYDCLTGIRLVSMK